jgi:hypothetical protein
MELLSQRSSAAVRAIHAAGSADHLHFLHDDHGRWCARINDRGITRQACSFRDAAAEARAWAKKIDVTTAAAIVVRGFGCGHHIAALAAKMRHLGTIIIYEPDTALLCEMLRRINLVECFGSSHVVLVTDPADASALAAGIAGLEGTLAAGLCVVDHPPSIARIGPTAEQFGQSLAHIVKAVRTNVVTTLVHSDVTARNCIQNLGTYVTVPGIQDLANVCAGHPAVVVSAGPSLRRNIALLSEPGIRDRVVIIDTAGRLHTQTNLMEELKKVRRVIEKRLPGAPHETLLVLDATNGQNAIRQAQLFKESVEVTGLILAKLDGTARGGAVFTIRDQLGLPVRYIGTGEQLGMLEPFDPLAFVDAIVTRELGPAVKET